MDRGNELYMDAQMEVTERKKLAFSISCLFGIIEMGHWRFSVWIAGNSERNEFSWKSVRRSYHTVEV